MINFYFKFSPFIIIIDLCSLFETHLQQLSIIFYEKQNQTRDIAHVPDQYSLLDIMQ